MGNQEAAHPSHGLVQFSRISGGPSVLFGSKVRKCGGHTFALRIMRGVERESLGDVRYSDGEHLIEVELSAAQFAELITSMNIGAGVPCTIRRFEGQLVEPCPDRELEHEVVSRKILKDLPEEIVTKLREAVDMLDTALASKSIRKGDLKEARWKVERALMELSSPRSGFAFYLGQFAEKLDEAKAAVMAEAEATMNYFVHRAGLAHLQGKRIEIIEDAPPVEMIEAGEE